MMGRSTEFETLIALGLLPWPKLSRPKSMNPLLTEKKENGTAQGGMAKANGDVKMKCESKIKELVESYHAAADPIHETLRNKEFVCDKEREVALREFNDASRQAGVLGMSLEEEAAMWESMGAR